MEFLYPCIVMCYYYSHKPIIVLWLTLLYYLAELMLQICKDDVLSTDEVASPLALMKSLSLSTDEVSLLALMKSLSLSTDEEPLS